MINIQLWPVNNLFYYIYVKFKRPHFLQPLARCGEWRKLAGLVKIRRVCTSLLSSLFHSLHNCTITIFSPLSLTASLLPWILVYPPENISTLLPLDMVEKHFEYFFSSALIVQYERDLWANLVDTEKPHLHTSTVIRNHLLLQITWRLHNHCSP